MGVPLCTFPGDALGGPRASPPRLCSTGSGAPWRPFYRTPHPPARGSRGQPDPPAGIGCQPGSRQISPEPGADRFMSGRGHPGGVAATAGGRHGHPPARGSPICSRRGVSAGRVTPDTAGQLRAPSGPLSREPASRERLTDWPLVPIPCTPALPGRVPQGSGRALRGQSCWPRPVPSG